MSHALDQLTGYPVADAGLIARATDLRDLLRKEAALGDEQRNLTEATFAALRDAGMFRLGVPRRWSGHQASTTTALHVLAELARGDAAASWQTFIFTDGAISASLLPDQAQEEVWGADPDATVSGVYTPAGTGVKVNDGYLLNGRWPFNTGSLRADWTQVAFPVFADDGSIAEVGLALAPYSDLTVEDTWFVAGMRATGSNTVVATDLFVPDYRVLPMRDLEESKTRSTHPDAHQIPKPVMSAEILAIVGPLLGAGQAAVDLARQVLEKERPITGSFYQKAADSPSYSLNYATAVSKVDTAFLHALRAAADVDRSVGREVPLDDLTRARIRMDMAVALQSLREAVTLSLSIGGASSFAEANPINKVWRDFETGSRQGYANPNIGHESYARALLGLEPIAIF